MRARSQNTLSVDATALVSPLASRSRMREAGAHETRILQIAPKKPPVTGQAYGVFIVKLGFKAASSASLPLQGSAAGTYSQIRAVVNRVDQGELVAAAGPGVVALEVDDRRPLGVRVRAGRAVLVRDRELTIVVRRRRRVLSAGDSLVVSCLCWTGDLTRGKRRTRARCLLACLRCKRRNLARLETDHDVSPRSRAKRWIAPRRTNLQRGMPSERLLKRNARSLS